MQKKRLAAVTKLPVQERPVSAAPEIGRLVGWKPEGGFEVECEGGERVFAETTLDLDQAALMEFVAEGRRVLVMQTKSRQYVVVGLLRAAGSVEASEPEEVNVRLDGDRLVLQGRREIELRCGASSIVLRADGEVVIRGNNVASRSRGPNILTGASIRLN